MKSTSTKKTPGFLPLPRAAALAVLWLAFGPAAASQFNCVVLPDAVVEVSSGTDGRIEHIGVERGDVVAAGQVLASLESGVEKANVALARAKADIDTEIHLREARLGFDRRRKERIQSLYQKAATSPQERDDADSEAVLSHWLLKQARDNKRLAQLELARAEELLALRTVRSPIGGVVVERYKWPGEFVEDEPIVGVARLDPLRVEVIVPVEQHGQIIRHMTAKVLTETAPDQPRVATVTVVDPMGDPASGTFRVALALPNPGNELLGGIKCMAEFLPESRIAAEQRARDAATARAVSAAAPVHQAVIDSAGEDSSPAACSTLGPLDDRATADGLAQALTQAGAKVSTRPVRANVDNGYIVLASPTSDDGDAWGLEKRLVAAGMSDLLVMSRGAYAGSVALGVYNQASAAERRRQAVAAKGVDARVAERTRRVDGWSVDIAMPQDPASRVRVEQIARAAGGEVRPCPSVLTAATAEPR